MYEGMLAEIVRVDGFNGNEIDSYLARPLGVGPYPGVVVIHHAPGWDEWSKEVVRKFAHHGYIAICPNLHFREGPGSPDDLAAAVRAGGGVPDDRFLGDLDGAMRYLRSVAQHNGKIGVIGFCSGGREAYLAAGRAKGLDAAVDCWGGRVIAAPEELTPRMPVAPISYTKDISCPVLGLFGADDRSPTPAQVEETESELKKYGKHYEFHMYDGAGHAFFATDRPSYRVEQANDGWQKVFAFYEKYLGAPA